ncbi:limonene-1,2-epoxide hydrolase [Catenulispora sp. GP43]|uniref:limonene-1,2-epoxide hydrolase family protein n=1 Tax=Catenulispora sp. GP43 TaxID=3156263 RepID=UPI00351931FD
MDTLGSGRRPLIHLGEPARTEAHACLEAGAGHEKIIITVCGVSQRTVNINHRRSPMESPIEVVRRFCAAWSDNTGAAELAAFFTEDATYHNIPLAPITGRQAIADSIASFIRPGPPGIEQIEFNVVNIAADGPIVMTERVDVFRLSDKSFELPVMGTFEVVDGKIAAWRDYFDMNQFTSRMG